MDWVIAKAFLSMLLIVGLMFGILLAVRRYFFTKPRFVNDNMKIISALSLQPKKLIYLVKVFDKVMLVGVSDNAIASLGEITDSELLQKIESATDKPRVKSFSDILKGFGQK